MNMLQKAEAKAKKRYRDWAILRLAGYTMEPIYKKWYLERANFQRDYIRFDQNGWVWSGNNAHKHVARALNTPPEEEDEQNET